jgi:hypothetical protein
MRVPNTTNSCKILIAAFLLAGLRLFAQSCGSGDCQPGVIAGPYSAPQTSENAAANFPVCTSASCQASAWVNDQIEGIDAQQNIGTDTSGVGTETNTVCVPEPSTNPSTIEAYGSPSCGDFSTPCVDSLGDRMANRLTYNNFSIAEIDFEFLTASHVVMESAANQSTGIRYYILGVLNGSAFPLINSGSGEVGPADLADPNHTLFYFMPSAALDKCGNLEMTYTVSGAHCSTCRVQPNPSVFRCVAVGGFPTSARLVPSLPELETRRVLSTGESTLRRSSTQPTI